VFTAIAPDVYAVSHRLVDGKNTIVFRTRGALAIDACNYPDEGQAMAAFIRGKTDLPFRLAITHGHGDGPILTGPAAVREHLEWTIGYLGSVRRCVADALGRGYPVERTIDEADYATFVGDRLPEEPFGMRRRHRMVVAKITAEVEAAVRA
jgi:hypothetical protein